MKLRIATRKSPLALVQTRWVAAQLKVHHPDIEIEEVAMTTRGDQILDRPLAEIGGKGLFVSEVERAILDDRADIAVHSMKDLPAELEVGLGLVCVPPREDPHDVLVARAGARFFDLEAGSRVGTSSLRRKAQLYQQRNDLHYASLRGNVQTRLSKLEDGQYDMIVLAAAGLKRLGLKGLDLQELSFSECLPAVGQGILAIEARLEDGEVRRLVAPLEHLPSRLAAEAERAYMKTLEGSCQLPLAAHAQLLDEGARMRFDAMVGSHDGERVIRSGVEYYLSDTGPAARLRAAHELGSEAAHGMLERGAGALVSEARQIASASTVGWKH